ncbi:MAG TPA: DUF5522 domain-containing protein [Hanamia sp.]
MINQLTEGVDFYYDESGLMVFTRKYHLKRGYCCGNGCRHCPYHFENVSDKENRRRLLENENNRLTRQ